MKALATFAPIRTTVRSPVLSWTILPCVVLLCACTEDHPDRLPGYVEGEFVYVSAPVSGKVQSVNIARGANVKPGTLLFTIEDVALRAQRDAAQARFDQARAALRDARKGQRPTELESLQAQLQQAMAAKKSAESDLLRAQAVLDAVGGNSQQEVDHARLARDRAKQDVTALTAQLKTAQLGARTEQLSAAQANVDALQAQLTQTQWELDQAHQSALAAGAVSDTLYREGEFVAAGHPIVVLLPPQNIKVRTYVPETMLSAIQPGNSATIFLDGTAVPLHGTVSFILPRMEFTPPVIYSHTMRSKFVALVEISFDPTIAGTLHPGQPVDVAFTR